MNERAELFRSYHHEGPVLVLPNAWDAGSAVVIARAGARAIATSSAGVAWSLGRPDGEHLAGAEVLAVVARIASAVDLPVTADVERGYDDVASTVRAVVAAGAVGVNLEDSQGAGGSLRAVEEQADRIRAARGADPDVVVNARTDVFLRGAGGVPEVVDRAGAYAEAGADCLFVPGLQDLDVLRRVVAAVPLPVNVMALPGGPGVADFAAVGVRRVSLAATLAVAAYEAAYAGAALALGEGTIPRAGGTLTSRQLNEWMSPAR